MLPQEKKRFFDCIIVGDAMFDITIKNAPQLTQRGTSYCKSISIHPGGSANVAFGISKLGGRAAFIGKVGKDPLGAIYLEDLKNNGIESYLIFNKNEPTGVIVVFVDNRGERTFLISRGANNTLHPSDVRRFKDKIIDSKFLYVSGYSIVENPQANAIIEAVNIAKESGVKIAFDPGSYNIIQKRNRIVKEIIASCDLFLPNLEEAQTLVDEKKYKDLVKALARLTTTTLVKTGNRGCIIIQGKSVNKIDAKVVTPIDTTGAGDAFTAAAIYGLTHNISITNVGKLANWFASKKVIVIGPRASPKEKEMKEYIRRLG